MKQSWRKRGRRKLVDAGRSAIVRTMRRADMHLTVELLEERHLLSAAAPKVLGVTSQSGVSIADSQSYDYAVQQFVVTFNEDMDTTGGNAGLHSVTNLANWQLTAGGQDISAQISTISWNAGARQAILQLTSPLLDDVFSLTASQELQDTEAQNLDGNGDGISGDNFTLSFTVPSLAGVKEFQVNTTTQGNQYFSRIAQNSAGDFVLTWSTDSPGSVARRFNSAGEPQSGEIVIGATGRIALLDSGEFIFAGSRPNAAFGRDLFVQRYDEFNHAQGDQIILAERQLHGINPVVAAASDGGFVVAFYQESGVNPGIVVHRYNADGLRVAEYSELIYQPTSLEILKNPVGGFLLKYERPSLLLLRSLTPELTLIRAADRSLPVSSTRDFEIASDGDIAVFYGNMVQWYRGSDLTAVGSPFTVATGATSSRIAALPARKLLFVFPIAEAGMNAGLGVVIQRYDENGQTIGGPVRVNTYTPLDQTPTDIEVTGTGNVLTVWNSSQQDGSKFGVYASVLLDSSAMTVGTITSDSNESVTENTNLLGQISSLSVDFSRVPSIDGDAIGPNSAVNIANWQVMEDGIDITNSINSISIDGQAVVLTFDKPLRGASYQLRARDTIEDTLGRALDGDGDGEPGGDFARNFGVHQGIFGVGPVIVANDRNTDAVNWPLVLAYVMPDGAFDVGWDGAYYDISNRVSVVRRFDATGAPMGGSFPVVSRGLTALAEDPFGDILVGAHFYPQPLISWVIKTDQFGQSLGSVQLRSEEAFDFGSEVVIAMNPDGDFVAVWEDGYGLHGQRFDQAFQKIGGILQLGEPFEGDIIPGAVAANSAGEFVVAWQDDSTVNVQKYNPQGEPLTAVIAFPSKFESAPNVAIDEAGEFVVVFNGSGSVPSSRRFDASGQPIGAQQRLNSDTSSGSYPRVAMAGDGRTMAIWLENVSGLERYMAIELDATTGEKVGSPFLIAEVPATGDFLPNIASNAAGDILVTWRVTADGSSSNVYARRLSFDRGAVVDLNGPAAGVDFATNLVEGGPAPLSNVQWMYVSDSAVKNLWSAMLSMVEYEPGDLVTVDTSGTSIVASFADGVLTLTGPDTVAHYEQVLKTATFASSVERPLGSEIAVTLIVNDGFYDSAPAHTVVTYALPVPPSVVGRHVFYNESAFDGNNADIQVIAPGAYNDDSDAIDFTKSPYLPGSGLATFANVTSYDKGINGIMIDLSAGGDHESITAADLVFKVGNNNSPESWTDAPAPTAVSVIPGAGTSGSHRIVITWATGAIRNTWLEVQVLANEHTGLDVPDVFYWGNLVGETGNGISATRFARTMAADGGAILARGTANTVGVANPFDIDKNNAISVAGDRGILLSLGTGWLARIDLESVEAASVSEPFIGDVGIASALASVTNDRSEAPASQMPDQIISSSTPTGAPALVQNDNRLLSAPATERALKQILADEHDDSWLKPPGQAADELADALLAR